MGFTHLYYHYAGPDQKGFIERYGKHVLAKIREGGAEQQNAPKAPQKSRAGR